MSAPFPLIFPFNTLKKNLQNLPCAKIIRAKLSLICTARKLIRAKLYQNHSARKLVRAKISVCIIWELSSGHHLLKKRILPIYFSYCHYIVQ